MTTGICTLSFFVPGLIIISIPGLSVFGTISIFAVEFLPALSPFALMLYAPTGKASSSATSLSRLFCISFMFCSCYSSALSDNTLQVPCGLERSNGKIRSLSSYLSTLPSLRYTILFAIFNILS